MNHSRAPAHEALGTRSTARVTATNKATTTIITKVFVDRVIPTSPLSTRRSFSGAFLPRGAGSRSGSWPRSSHLWTVIGVVLYPGCRFAGVAAVTEA
jgi:hypothetical protein